MKLFRWFRWLMKSIDQFSDQWEGVKTRFNNSERTEYREQIFSKWFQTAKSKIFSLVFQIFVLWGIACYLLGLFTEMLLRGRGHGLSFFVSWFVPLVLALAILTAALRLWKSFMEADKSLKKELTEKYQKEIDEEKAKAAAEQATQAEAAARAARAANRSNAVRRPPPRRNP